MGERNEEREGEITRSQHGPVRPKNFHKNHSLARTTPQSQANDLHTTYKACASRRLSSALSSSMIIIVH